MGLQQECDALQAMLSQVLEILAEAQSRANSLPDCQIYELNRQIAEIVDICYDGMGRMQASLAQIERIQAMIGTLDSTSRSPHPPSTTSTYYTEETKSPGNAKQMSNSDWPPQPPEGAKPNLNDPGAAEWRYQRYKYDQYQAGKQQGDILPFEIWKKWYEEAEPVAIRQYEEIIALTDDVSQIAKNLGIVEEQIRKVKEHIFINEHELEIPDNQAKTVISVRSNFTPDAEIADLWFKAKNGSLQPRESLKFKRLIAHEYIEQGLMQQGLPYRSPEAWRDDPIYGFGNWPTPEHYGAHDLAPNTGRPNPFSHWDKIIGKSPQGLTLRDDLSNLDELLEAIRERI
ncbi:MAG: hypothetical protein KME26_25320 [Oscillatoria princeps RMCB-10]|jgi:hypothetical protein|nr:hypothetical protein [Oscillatoria princeps RMCB-10]